VNRQLRFCCALLLLGQSACSERPITRPAISPSVSKTVTPHRDTILHNMPLNSHERCVGISAAVEALLEAEPQPSSNSIALDDLADEIYASLKNGRNVRYYSQVVLDGQQNATDSALVLENLCTRITALYQRDFELLKQDDQGRRALVAAQSAFLKSKSELHRVLENDSDKTVMFCGVGERRFPDETLKDTFHAFLLYETETGTVFVYDPNDPGSPIACQIDEADGELTIQWKCPYRDTGHVTTQSYSVVDAKTFFGTIMERDRD
jgi:hypothetical protein